MKLTDLHEDNQLAILEQLPLMTQIRTAALVCRTWNRLVDDLCRRRAKLVLSYCRWKRPCQKGACIYDSLLEAYSHSDHHLILNNPDRIPDSNLQLILRKFPNIRRFEYYHIGLFVTELVTLFLHWRSRLTSLVIYIFKHIYTNEKPINPTADELSILLQSLHELPNLRQLKLYDHSPRRSIRTTLPNLSQLETLYFGWRITNPREAETFVNSSWQNLTQFGQRTGFKEHIEEGFNPHVPDQVYKRVIYEPEFTLDPVKFSTKLTHFHTNQLYENSQWSEPERFICLKYPALTHLSLNTILPLEDLLTRYGLHQLEALEKLTVAHHYGYYKTLDSKHLPLELTPPPGEKIQFRTLNQLSLAVVPHWQMDQFESCFPLLRTIKISNSNRLQPVISCKRCDSEQAKNDLKYRCEIATFESLFKWKVVPTVYYSDTLVKSVQDVKMLQWEYLTKNILFKYWI